MISGSVTLLEPPGPVQTCTGIALTFKVKLKYPEKKQFEYHLVHHIPKTNLPGIISGMRKQQLTA